MDNNGGVPQATANHHEIELMKRQLLASMSKDIEAAPKWSNESAEESSYCIFRVPQGFAGVIAKECRPCIVSIGPYHHGEPQLQMLQEHKWGFLHTMLDQTQAHGVGLEDLINIVASKEKMIRQCYSESTDTISGLDLVKMMVLDGCFIIQFLRQIAAVEQTDPLLQSSYVCASIARDLLRVENQVPYFVLEDLFETTDLLRRDLSLPLADLALCFFRCFPEVSGNARERRRNEKGVHLLDSFRLRRNEKGVHLLDSFRLSLIPWDQQENPIDDNGFYLMTRSASELRRVGIGFKQREASTILEITFDSKHRTIGIPKISVGDNLNFILPNMVAFEQCRGLVNGHMTAYAMFMGCLIHTVNDVQLLRDRKVIIHGGKSNEDVARFFSDVCKDATFYNSEGYLASHVVNLNKSLKHERAYLCGAQLANAFHDNPWSALSGLAVVVTLAGMIQTVYALLQYYHPK